MFRTLVGPAIAYEQAKRVASIVKVRCAAAATQFQSPVSRAVVVELVGELASYRAQLVSFAAIPGIGAYAKAQTDDPAYDVAAEFAAVLAAITAVITQVHGAFPVSATGEIEEKVLNSDGTVSPRTFTVGQLATARGLLNNVVAAIE